jgi:cation transport regulator ChaC
MWYFAYGSNLNTAAFTDWCRKHHHRGTPLKCGRPAVLDNHRLCFPIYSDVWGGGIADIVYDPGKYVAGALFEVTEHELSIIDQKVNRRLDAGREVGQYKRAEVRVSPLGKGEAVKAVTYTGVHLAKDHVPPTRLYIDLLTQGAYQIGLSMMWIAYIQSFSTQPDVAGAGPTLLR